MNNLNLRSLVLLFFLLPLVTVAQQLNLKDDAAKRIQEKKLIVITTGDSLVDAYLKNAVDKKWEFTDSIQYMSLDASNQLVNDRPNTFSRLKLQLIRGVLVRYMNEQDKRRNIELDREEYGDMMKLVVFEDDASKGNGFEVALPSNSELSEGVVVEVIQRTCHILKGIEENGSWNKFAIKNKNGQVDKLENRTLLIPLEFMGNVSDSTEMKSLYPYKIKFVPSEEIYTAIEKSDDAYAYVLVAEELVNVHMHYICLTSNSEILAHHHKVVQTSNTITSGGRHMDIDLKIFKKLVKRI